MNPFSFYLWILDFFFTIYSSYFFPQGLKRQPPHDFDDCSRVSTRNEVQGQSVCHFLVNAPDVWIDDAYVKEWEESPHRPIGRWEFLCLTRQFFWEVPVIPLLLIRPLILFSNFFFLILAPLLSHSFNQSITQLLKSIRPSQEQSGCRHLTLWRWWCIYHTEEQPSWAMTAQGRRGAEESGEW